MTNRRSIVCTLVASLMIALPGTAAAGEPAPVRVVVGSIPALAVHDRVDPQRRGRSPVALPQRPRLAWSKRLPGGIRFAPAVAADGSFFMALSQGRVARVSADGDVLWQRNTGGSAPQVPPAVTSDGSVAVLTGDGELVVISRGGNVRWRLRTGLIARRGAATPLPLDNGSIAIAADRRLMIVDAWGRSVAQARVPFSPAGGLLPWRGGLLALSSGGKVATWEAPARPVSRGSLGGAVADGQALLASDRFLLAVTDRRNVVALDLARKRARTLVSVDGLRTQLDGTLTLAANGLLWAQGGYGELIGLDASGRVVRRGALAPLPALPPPVTPPPAKGILTALKPAVLAPSPPLIAGPGGRLGFVRASGKVGIVLESGQVQVASSSFCARPVSVSPAGKGAMLVACRDGTVGRFADLVKDAP
ncbi:MAG: PQQ-binding-like beta-propeller repeat protein [Myxococcota bacterium]